MEASFKRARPQYSSAAYSSMWAGAEKWMQQQQLIKQEKAAAERGAASHSPDTGLAASPGLAPAAASPYPASTFPDTAAAAAFASYDPHNMSAATAAAAYSALSANNGKPLSSDHSKLL